MMRALVVAAIAVVLLTSFGDADTWRIRAHTHVVRAVEPGEVEVYVSVPPAPTNRAYTVTASCDGDQVERSYRPLDGERSEGPFAPIVWKNLPGCSYAIATELLGAGDQPIARAKPMIANVLCMNTCEPTPDEIP